MIFLVVEMLIPERKKSRSRASALAASPDPARTGQPGQARRPSATVATAVFICLMAPVLALASPSSALREYNQGKYDEALKEYEKLLEKKKDDPRLHFNAGTAAYRTHQFEEAQKQFNEALNSPDLKLLQQAYYNRGNTLFHLGAANSDPEKRKKAWEDALKDYESTLQLNKQDADARHNHDLIQKMLEELKKQQEQQQQNKDNKSDQKQDQIQDQQNQQAKNDQDKQSKDDKSQQNKQDQPQDQKNQQAKNDQQDKDKKDKDQKASNQQQDQKQKDAAQKQQPANGSKDKDKSQDKGQEEQAYAVGQMTPQQAEQMLDAQKNEEMLLPVKPEGQPRSANRQLRDW